QHQPDTVEDHEFDAGSRIVAQELTPAQIENLALLGRVWGFVKYHHPRVVDSSRNWDYELFRAVPLVVAAPDRQAAAAAIVTWIDKLGPVPLCNPCAQPPADAHLQPRIDWLEDRSLLGGALSGRLVDIHRSRPVSPSQRYVIFPPVGNANFRESSYASLPDPDAGYRLLALFRLWNIIEYWFPYRDVIGEDWDAVLREFIPQMMQHIDGDTYRQTLLRLFARIHDTHANIWSDLRVQPPMGDESAPFALSFVEGKLVIAAWDHADGLGAGLKPGDVIERIDGLTVESLVDSLRPFYPASNEAARLRDIARRVTRGTGPVLLEGSGAEGAFSKVVQRVPVATLWGQELDHDLNNVQVFKMLSDDVAYLKISTAKSNDIAGYIAQAGNASVLVVDCRGYPTDYLIYSLGGHLTANPVPFARVTAADPANPGAFVWKEPLSQIPRTPTFKGKIVILVDETTQSAAEFLAMALRAAPNAIVMGSTTAGADGNVSGIPLPGGVGGLISGIGIFYPDRSPTQRVGIVPDVVLNRTIAGVRGTGESVLNRAISHALGRTFTASAASPAGR
ncbi:MAG TPA: S41 family peptidase, partial [Gemmatimonadaceae bacterium]|nr:S41 family peptidase [Gemmatimonadaceae bacterium]